MKKYLLLAFAVLALASFGSVNLKWTVETSRLEPVTFDAVHGETLSLEAVFKSYGKPLELTGKTFEIFYQTNKMGSAWWRTSASVSSNSVTALFTPEMDPGASVVHGFLGSTGDIYRAAFTIRFRNGPGAKPNEIPLPVKTLDLATVELKNIEASPLATKEYVDMSVTGSSTPLTWDNIADKPGWITYSKPKYSAEEVGAYPEKSGTQLEGQVATIGAHLNTEDAKFIVTNYNSSTKIPAAHVQIRQKNAETGEFEWLHIWNEMTRWNKFTGLNFDWDKWPGFDSWRTNIEDQISARAVREYAFYDGVTGDVAPDGYFWVGQPKIAICAGASYQRYVNGKNAIWILESNGMIADINGTTNGYFRISDAEGKTHFEIVKGDKRTVYAKQYAFRSETIMGVPHYFTTYAITNAVSSPIAHVSVEGLVPGAFVPENDPNCAANIKWSSVPGGYTLEWWPKADYPSMFVYADYEIGGETYIRNTAPVSMQTIVIDGKKYKIGVSTVSGTKVLSLTEVE